MSGLTHPPSTPSPLSGYQSEAPSTASSHGAVAPEPSALATLPLRNGRKGSKKVRTGCITCKIRRVKCDEGKPECLRCVKTGRKCDGYLTKGDNSFSRDSRSPAPLRPNGPNSLPTAYPGWDVTEQRAFHFYRTCSSNHLFSVNTASFWGRVIPGLCFQEPAIRHAAIAISDLHERGYLGLSSMPAIAGQDRRGYPVLSAFAAFHYGKAMKALQNWTPPTEGLLAGNASMAVPLLACCLFVCVEFMLGNESVAQLHMNQGRQILATFQLDETAKPHPGVELIRKELVPIFTRLSLAGFLFGSSPAPIPEALRWNHIQPGTDTHLVFKDMVEAEQALYEILDSGLRFTRRATVWVYASVQQMESEAKAAQRLALEQEQKHYLAMLEKWHMAFTIMRAAGAKSERDALSAKMCGLYYTAAYVLISRALKSKQTDFDQNTPSMASMVVLGGEILDECERMDREAGGPSQVTRFSFESGIIAPIYFVATRARHPGLRRAAIAVLRRRAMNASCENLWNARRVVLIAQRTMRLEEEQAMVMNYGQDDPTMPSGDYVGDGQAVDSDYDYWTSRFLQAEGVHDFNSDSFGGHYPEWIRMIEEQAMPYRVVLQSTPASRVQPEGEPELSEADIDTIVRQIPTYMPPSIRWDEAPRIFGSERAPEGQTGAESASPAGQQKKLINGLPPPLEMPPWALDGGQALQSPFNIPERARMKNAVISPQVDNGNWVTWFMEPEPGTGPHWRIVREFISLDEYLE